MVIRDRWYTTKSNIKAITSTAVAPQINKVGTTTIDKATPERRDKPAATKPVSYTHLDVYKRQGYIVCNLFSMFSFYIHSYLVQERTE